MFRRILMMVLFLFVPLQMMKAQSSLWTEVMYRTGDAGDNTQINISASKKFTPSFGAFVWSISSKGWGESIVGAVYSPRPWVEFDLGAGLEKNEHPFRTQASVWVGNKKGSLYAAVENGGSGFWYVATGNMPVQSNFGIGFRAQRFVGIGPRFQITKKNIMFWVVPIAWDPELSGAKNTSVALRFTP